MFCKKCGKELNQGAKVCPNCGTKVSSGTSVINLFKSSKYLWGNELNQSDCCISPIPEDIKSDMRLNFGIGYNEKILFIRDTSFWNSRDQGLVLTDEGICCIPDNDKPTEKIILPWSAIQRVEYKDLVLYFWGYGDETDYCPIHISYFMKNEDNEKARRIGSSLARLFTQMAQCVEPEADPFDTAATPTNSYKKAKQTKLCSSPCRAKTKMDWKYFILQPQKNIFYGKNMKKPSIYVRKD